MLNCKFCHSKNLVKSGFAGSKQKFLCKKCRREQRSGDLRQKTPMAPRKMAVLLYLEGNGFRGISRILTDVFGTKISYQIVSQWIKKAGKIVEEIVEKTPIKPREIAILEMDELFTFVKKNSTNSNLDFCRSGQLVFCCDSNRHIGIGFCAINMGKVQRSSNKNRLY